MKGHLKWPFPVSPKTVLLAVAAGIALVVLLRALTRRTGREGFQTQGPSSTEAAIVPAIKLIGKGQEVTPQACEIVAGMLTGLTKQLDEAQKRDNTVALKTLQSSITVIEQQLRDMNCAELQAPAAAPNTTS